MNAFFFGPSARPLFGALHTPDQKSGKTAVLLCPAWGPEYMRSQRGLRLLAERLAAAGLETLRFDYSGTGDSAGHALDARLEHWFDDLALAATELRELSGARRLCLIGLRLGGLLAAHAPALAAERLLLWDAPGSGADFAALMRRLGAESDHKKNRQRSRATQLPAPAANELFGHAWPAPLAESLQALQAPLPQAGRIWLNSSDHDQPPPAGAECLSLPDAAHWREETWLYTPYAPLASINRVVEQLAQWT